MLSLALLILGALAYYPVLFNDFIELDDVVYITENPHVLGGLSVENLQWAWTTWHAGYWHPLTWMSLQLDASLFGPDGAWGFHLDSLLWHLASSVLLFHVLIRMTGQVGPSWFVAALFLLHPMHVESVAWGAERKDVLSAFFWILTLWCYVAWVQAPSRGRMVLTCLVLVIGLLCKPMLVTLPCVLVLLDYWPLSRWAPGGLFARVREKWPLWLITIGASLLTVLTQKDADAVVSLARLSILDRLANSSIGYLAYLESTFWPVNLAPFYPHPFEHWPPGRACLSFVVIAAITYWAWRQRTGAPWLLVGWLWFLGALAPVIGFVQAGAQSHADRFSYLPHIGLFIAIVWQAASWPVARNAALGFGMAVLSICTWLTWQQTQYWVNREVLWHHALDATGPNYRAYSLLGTYYVNRNDLEKARIYYEQGLRAFDGFVDLHYNLGCVLLAQGKFGEAEVHLRNAVRLDPTADHWHNLGVAVLKQGRLESAATAFRNALKQSPHLVDSQLNLGLTLSALGQLDQAEAFLDQALAIKPAYAEAHNQKGLLYLRRNQPAEAERAFQRAIALKGPYPVAQQGFAISLGRQLDPSRWKDVFLGDPRKILELAQLTAQSLGADQAQDLLQAAQLANAP